MFIELYEFSKLVMHLNSRSMDLGHDSIIRFAMFGGLECIIGHRIMPIRTSCVYFIRYCLVIGEMWQI